MKISNKTAREIFNDLKSNPSRTKFGFGKKAALVNVDPQKAYTCVDEFKTAYETDPRQMEYINIYKHYKSRKKQNESECPFQARSGIRKRKDADGVLGGSHS